MNISPDKKEVSFSTTDAFSINGITIKLEKQLPLVFDIQKIKGHLIITIKED